MTTYTDISGLAWILGKAKPEISVTTLQDLLITQHESYDEQSIYQLLISLQNCFFVKAGSAQYGEVKTKTKFEELEKVLNELSNNPKDRISNQAKQTVETLDWFKSNGK